MTLYEREYLEAPSYSFVISQRPRSEGIFKVFIAGGISGCPDWQSYVVKELMLSKSPIPTLLLNPRREDFPMDDPTAAEAQIKWEFEALEASQMILFWFPEETLCPITLFELGRWSSSRKRLVVGCDPGYKRRLDVEIQMKLIQPGLEIHDNLQDLISAASIEMNDLSESSY